ncbi:AcrR family transcriptional regulator [Microbacterium trichothecenolyticum]|uniref:TetR family transcriptional regulator n=1 Tax=Microbacterium trichothecenolyticum TaxID=69370 RepID=UPI002866A0B9|nr:TetR family transcriptional regulator [Microbacterium trichothecenolyticum]MDR7187014.1 AcrR family transcriptional regulator [Microbacterium trichothecenolyticum]
MRETTPVPIRERTRRLAQTELTSVAQDLFVAQGYDGTTVDQIAAAAGMSKRTFFRYFPSKDDLVIGKYDLFADRMAGALDDRPADEPVWMSLRRVFDITLDYVQDDQQRARNDAMDEIVRSSPQLHARYLEKMQRVQELLIGRVAARLTNGGPTPSDPRPAAIVGAAFACMHAARQAWFASDRSEAFGSYLDDAMGIFDIDPASPSTIRSATSTSSDPSR